MTPPSPALRPLSPAVRTRRPGPRRRQHGLRSLALVGLLGLVFGAGVATGGVSGGSLAAGSSANPGGGPGSVVPESAPADFGVYWQALQVVKDHFVDTSRLGDEQLTWGSIRGLVAALGDTGHSVFMTPDDVKAEQDSLNGRLSGIGVVIDHQAGSPVIISVFEDTPAHAAGLRAGDLITSIDGTSTDRLTVDEIVAHVRGEAGTTVVLGIRHPDGREEDVPVVRADIVVPSTSWAFVPGTHIADLKLVQFSAGAGKDVRRALRAALDAGATGVVLDLRGNPGGLVDEAVGVASAFLAEGVVYQERDRDGHRTDVPVRDHAVAPNVPLAVLIDRGSASAAEIVAAALQDSGRGRLVGQRTFGTGTVLNSFPLSDGSAIRLGVIEWLTPKGRGLFETGVTPDVVVKLPADGDLASPGDLRRIDARGFAHSTDSQLKRAVRLLRTRA